MALVTRLSRLFQADFHAVLDRIEEPDIQLKQAVREMQLALDEDEQRLTLLQHELEQLRQLNTEKTNLQSQLDEELDICFDAQKEDLARDLIHRKLIAENQQQNLLSQITGIEAELTRLGKQVTQQRQQLSSMHQKLELLVSRDNPYTANHVYQTDTIRSEDIDIAFLREKQRRARS